MILEKNGKTIELIDDSHISGFKSSGWTEVKQIKQEKVQKDKATTKNN